MPRTEEISNTFQAAGNHLLNNNQSLRILGFRELNAFARIGGFTRCAMLAPHGHVALHLACNNLDAHAQEEYTLAWQLLAHMADLVDARDLLFNAQTAQTCIENAVRQPSNPHVLTVVKMMTLIHPAYINNLINLPAYQAPLICQSPAVYAFVVRNAFEGVQQLIENEDVLVSLVTNLVRCREFQPLHAVCCSIAAVCDDDALTVMKKTGHHLMRSDNETCLRAMQVLASASDARSQALFLAYNGDELDAALGRVSLMEDTDLHNELIELIDVFLQSSPSNINEPVLEFLVAWTKLGSVHQSTRRSILLALAKAVESEQNAHTVLAEYGGLRCMFQFCVVNEQLLLLSDVLEHASVVTKHVQWVNKLLRNLRVVDYNSMHLLHTMCEHDAVINMYHAPIYEHLIIDIIHLLISRNADELSTTLGYEILSAIMEKGKPEVACVWGPHWRALRFFAQGFGADCVSSFEKLNACMKA
jgi:hypothetical protein